MLLSVNEIADELGVSVGRVHYVTLTRGIKPVGWIANRKMFTPEQVPLIRSHLKQGEGRTVALRGEARTR